MMNTDEKRLSQTNNNLRASHQPVSSFDVNFQASLLWDFIGCRGTNDKCILEDIDLKDERELRVHPVSAPCQLRFEVSRDYWQLLNFLQFIVDERERNALWYQRDLNHNVGDLDFMEDVEQLYSQLPGTALLFESINFILNWFGVASH